MPDRRSWWFGARTAPSFSTTRPLWSPCPSPASSTASSSISAEAEAASCPPPRPHFECGQARARVLLPLHSTVRQLGAEQRIRARRHAHLQPVDPHIFGQLSSGEPQRGRSARPEAEAAIDQTHVQIGLRSGALELQSRATARRHLRARARASRPRPRARQIPWRSDRAPIEPHARDAEIAQVDLAVAHDQRAYLPVPVQGGGRGERRVQPWPGGRERDPGAALQL